MEHYRKIFVFLMMLHLLRSAVGAPYCSVGNPKFKENKNGYIYGIPASGYCLKSGKRAKVQYVIPVDNVNAAPKNSENKNIFSLGLYPSARFTAELVPLKEYLTKYNIPSYMKFLFINSKDIDCNK